MENDPRSHTKQHGRFRVVSWMVLLERNQHTSAWWNHHTGLECSTVLPANVSQHQLSSDSLVRRPDRHGCLIANMKPIKSALLILSLLSLSLVVIAQAQRGAQRPGEQKTAKPAQPQTDLPASNQDIETVKIDTNLVTVPVIASSRTGSYIADLKKEEFKVSEDLWFQSKSRSLRR